MQLTNFAIVAAALSARVAADFVVITEPTPTNLAALGNLPSYIASIESVVTSRLAFLTQSIPVSEASKAASAAAQLKKFVATASYSIPSDVADIGALETFTTAPPWYTALPSDLKSYYDSKNAVVQSVVNVAVNGDAGSSAMSGMMSGMTTAAMSGSGSGSAKPSATGAGTQSTGAATPERVAQYVGAGAAAVFAGVMAL